jgi:hypothetical protein
MPFVPAPKDLSRVKPKLLLNLTKRQLICFSLAAAVGIPVYLLAKGAAGNTAAALIMIALMLPFFFLAMYERDGRPAEKILLNLLRAKLWPGTRPYRTDNLYKYLQEEAIKHGSSKSAGVAGREKGAGAAARGKRPAGKSKPRRG